MDSVNFRDLSVESFDTRTLLSHAKQQAEQRRYEDFLIVDVDAHHYETDSYAEICEYIEDPVMRDQALYQGFGRAGLTTASGGYQNLGGRLTRYPGVHKEKTPATPHRDITLTKRWMDAIGIDVACMFPTPMLQLGSCPRIDVEVALARAYNRWLCDRILAHEPRIRSTLYLPFRDPEACYQMVQDFGDKKGVIGFTVVSPRQESRLRQRLHEDLARDRRAQPDPRLPRRLYLGRRPACRALQPLHGGACAGLHLVQHPAHDELAGATGCPSASRSSGRCGSKAASPGYPS